MSGLDDKNYHPDKEKKQYFDLACNILVKSWKQLWAMTPWGDAADVAYFTGMDESEDGKEELKRIKGLSIGCAVYGCIFGFFMTMWFMHVSDILIPGGAMVIGTVLNTILLILLLFTDGAFTAFVYFVLKWTIVKKMGRDGTEYLQVAITYAILCMLVFSLLAFVLPFNVFGVFG